MFRLVIAGSRSFKNYSAAKPIILNLLRNRRPEEVTIVSGGAEGADRVGEMFAREFNLKVERYIPNWSEEGKRAGMLRNKIMSENSDATLLFWDGESKGSKDMYWQTLDVNNPLIVVYFNKETKAIIEVKNESNPF